LPTRGATDPQRVRNAPREEKSREEEIRGRSISEPLVPLSPPDETRMRDGAAAGGDSELVLTEPARAIREALESSPRLRCVATDAFALQLANHTSEGGHSGRFTLAQALESIAEADTKLATDEAVNELSDRRAIGRLVRGCVQSGPRTTRPAAGGKPMRVQPGPDAWASGGGYDP
jgi:hypothetical protein